MIAHTIRLYSRNAKRKISPAPRMDGTFSVRIDVS